MLNRIQQSLRRIGASHFHRTHETVSCLRRVRHAARRWSEVLFLSLIAVLVFGLVLPFGWGLDETGALERSPIRVFLVTTAVLFALLSPFPFRWRHLVNLGWYPPTWTAVPIGFTLVVQLERYGPAGLWPQAIQVDRYQPFVVVPVYLAIGIVILLRLFTSGRSRTQQSANSPRPPETQAPSRGNQESNAIRRWLTQGERPIGTSEDDLFSRNALAARITQQLAKGQSVALVGPLGSGKSSVLNLVRARLCNTTTTTILAPFDVWAVPEPKDVPRLALARVVDALGDHVDMTALRGVPTLYQRLVAAAPVSRLDRILQPGAQKDSITTLRKLVPILEVLDARLILIVEDSDRTSKTFETRHLLRLLWALHDLPRTTFVLALDPNRGPQTDFTKVCDKVERLDALQDTELAAVVSAAVHYWTSEYSDIKPTLARPDKLGLQYTREGGTLGYMYRTSVRRPLRYLAQVVQTPRRLKRVLQRVDVAWRQLHGEVDLEDLLLVATFRELCPSVYGFLREHIDAARLKADEGPSGSSAVGDDWNQLLKTLSNPEATQHLVALLGIAQLSGDRGQPAGESPQGVHFTDPTDYLDRIHTEGIDSTETRDQSVLSEIDTWEQHRTDALIERLAASRGDNARYAAVWEHFSFRHTPARLVQLMVGTVRFLLRADGADATMEHPALLALWRVCRDQLLNEANKSWIQNVALEAVPVNVSFAVDFYDYLARDDRRIVSPQESEEIRCLLIERIQNVVCTDSDLLRHLSEDSPYRISSIIRKTGAGQGTAPFEMWGKHLAPILVGGAKNHPEQVLPELANLLGAADSHERIYGREPPDFTNPYTIDRARAEALLGGFLDDALVQLASYEGKNPYARRATRAAASWLQERGDKARN